MPLLTVLWLSLAALGAAPASSGLQSLHEAPLLLDVKDIAIQDTSASKEDPLNIARFLTPPLNSLMSWWLKDRFQASGKAGLLSFKIRRARITETPFEKGGWFTAPKVCFEADLCLEVSLPTGVRGQNLVIHVRTRTIESERLNLFERQKAWMRLMEDAINALDQEIMGRPNFQSVILRAAPEK